MTTTTHAAHTTYAALPNDAALLVLLPDSRLPGVVERLAARLTLVRPHIAALSYGVLEPASVARLYRHNTGAQDPGRVDGTWLGRLVFSRGPSLALLLRSGIDVGDFSTLLATWKGSSAPTGRSGGALRSVAAFSNRCMSVLHTPDDARQAREDARLFFPDELIDGALAGSAAARRPAPGWDDVTLLMRPLALTADVSPELFLRRMLAKALTLLATDSALAPWWDAAQSPTAVARQLWDGALGPSVLRFPRPAVPEPAVDPRDPGAAARARRSLNHRRELATVLALIANGHTGGDFAQYAVSVLVDNGLLPDPWEEHMALTTLTFPADQAKEIH